MLSHGGRDSFGWKKLECVRGLRARSQQRGDDYWSVVPGGWARWTWEAKAAPSSEEGVKRTVERGKQERGTTLLL